MYLEILFATFFSPDEKAPSSLPTAKPGFKIFNHLAQVVRILSDGCLMVV